MNLSKAEISSLIRYAESLDSKVSEDSKEALRGLISQGEALGQIVFYYTQCQSPLAVDLLSRVKEPHHVELFNRIQEVLFRNTLAAVTLFGQIVQKSPSWLPKLPDHSLFECILRIIKTTQDVTILISSILLVSTLLPYVVGIRKGHVADLFTGMVAACSVYSKYCKAYKREGDELNNIYATHLRTAIFHYFLLLYTMYPVNLLNSLRYKYGQIGESETFKVIGSMLDSVRFNSNLLKMTAEQEIDRSRWSLYDVQSLFDECGRISVPFCTKTPHQTASGDVSSKLSNPSLCSAMGGDLEVSDIHKKYLGEQENCSVASSDIVSDRWPEIDMRISALTASNSTLPKDTSFDSSEAPSVAVEKSERSVTGGTEDLRHYRRSAFTRRLNDFIKRKKPNRSETDEITFLPSSVYHSAFDATGEYDDRAESIEEIYVQEETHQADAKHLDQIEEAIDANEICSSAAIPQPKIDEAEEQPSTTPATVIALEDFASKKTMEDLLSTVSLGPSRSSSVSSSRLGKRQCEPFRVVYRTKQEMDSCRNRNKHEIDTISIHSANENRFSVSSFFKALNRERFSSEFRQARRDSAICESSCTHFSKNRKNRWSSCPDLVSASSVEAVHRHSGSLSHHNGSFQKSVPHSCQLSHSRRLDELTNKKLSYFPHFHPLQVTFLEDKMDDMELKAGQESAQRLYLEANTNYHENLKELNLVERVPQKIYDDLSSIIKGLPLEKQVSILSARLALVNQHLLFERCGRLMHAERSTRLHALATERKALETENELLKTALREARVEREKLTGALTEHRRRDYQEKANREDIERRYCEQLQNSRNDVAAITAENERLNSEIKKLIEANIRWQSEVEFCKRKCEDTNMRLLFAEKKLETVDRLKLDLKNANKSNQRLRDDLIFRDIRYRDLKSTTKADYDVAQLLHEIAKLKDDSVKDRNEASRCKAKAREHEMLWRQENTRCKDLRVMLQRAKEVHAQQCDAAQHKYLSLLNIYERQQATILELNAKIEELSSRFNVSANSDGVPVPRSSSVDLFPTSISTQSNESFFLPEIFVQGSQASSGNWSREPNPDATNSCSTDDAPHS